MHWDLRLERDGVLASWAVPKGIPMRTKPNHLAVRTEDHPMEYLDFAGDIPRGEYGGGSMGVWDTGTYDVEKWRDDEVMAVFHGSRMRGRYVLFRTEQEDGRQAVDDPPHGPARRPDARARPARPQADARDEHQTISRTTTTHWSYEMKWDGMRAIVVVEGGRVRATSRQGNDATPRFPELAGLGRALGSTEAVLDGEIVTLDDDGKPSFERLQPRMQAGNSNQVRKLMEITPAVYMCFDLLWLDGHSVTHLPVHRSARAARAPRARRARPGRRRRRRSARARRHATPRSPSGSRAS